MKKIRVEKTVLPSSTITLILLLAFSSAAQDLPDKIRGYTVYQPKVKAIKATVSTAPATSAPVSLRGSKLISITPLGVTFEADMNIAPIPQDGSVDFLTFHDFRVNGVPVEIEEYSSPFTIRKNEPISLPKPASVFLSTPRIAQAAWREMRDSKEHWTVAGRVFVFGRFKKYGMTFKRVVPVDISFSVKNPIQCPTGC